MGKTFEAIEQAKREKDSQKATAPLQLKKPLQTNLWVISGTGKLPSV